MTATQISPERIWQALEGIPDPEIPVVSITDMGMVRDVQVDGERVTVTFTPTFSGCPALHVIRDSIGQAVRDLGVTDVEVKSTLTPPWTTDWMNADARERLRQYGISPPQGHACHAHMPEDVVCPRCGSRHTSLISEFGSTACKALYRCDSCREPFDYFKCI